MCMGQNRVGTSIWRGDGACARICRVAKPGVQMRFWPAGREPRQPRLPTKSLSGTTIPKYRIDADRLFVYQCIHIQYALAPGLRTPREQVAPTISPSLLPLSLTAGRQFLEYLVYMARSNPVLARSRISVSLPCLRSCLCQPSATRYNEDEFLAMLLLTLPGTQFPSAKA